MGTYPTQNWTKIVWNDWNVPKHSFISWLIMQEGLNTKAKLYAYGFCLDDICIICQVQKCVEDWIGRPFPTVNELLNANRNNMKWKALAMVLTTYRYYVWSQRNHARIQLNVFKPVVVAERMKKMIQQQIRRLTDLRGGQTDLEITFGFPFDPDVTG
ncbi:uncharacterized protein LOC141619410 [Silene latifolia]|uniref:uncharacterized protein LOC141619410 n=1 Tax=Silene latifolia TaxID=37657 RepID=UPI003D7773F7